jgi:hypothetical protein
MISFPTIDYKVLRATTWDVPVGVIADKTRCGRKKRRPSNQLAPKVYSVTLQFKTLTDYNTFKSWFEETLYHGALSFSHPDLEGIDGTLKEYAFQEESTVGYSNTSGHIMQATMTWEEV